MESKITKAVRQNRKYLTRSKISVIMANISLSVPCLTDSFSKQIFDRKI